MQRHGAPTRHAVRTELLALFAAGTCAGEVDFRSASFAERSGAVAALATGLWPGTFAFSGRVARAYDGFVGCVFCHCCLYLSRLLISWLIGANRVRSSGFSEFGQSLRAEHDPAAHLDGWETA